MPLMGRGLRNAAFVRGLTDLLYADQEMRRGARTGRGGLALDNVFRRLLVASLQHRLAPRIWGLDLS